MRFAKGLQLGQVIQIQGIRTADGHGNAVTDYRVSLSDLIEDPKRTAAGIHEILAQDFEPVDLRMILEDVREMHCPQTDAKSEIRVAPAVHRNPSSTTSSPEQALDKPGQANAPNPETHLHTKLEALGSWRPSTCLSSSSSHPGPCNRSCLCSHWRCWLAAALALTVVLALAVMLGGLLRLRIIRQ